MLCIIISIESFNYSNLAKTPFPCPLPLCLSGRNIVNEFANEIFVTVSSIWKIICNIQVLTWIYPILLQRCSEKLHCRVLKCCSSSTINDI